MNVEPVRPAVRTCAYREPEYLAISDIFAELHYFDMAFRGARETYVSCSLSAAFYMASNIKVCEERPDFCDSKRGERELEQIRIGMQMPGTLLDETDAARFSGQQLSPKR